MLHHLHWIYHCCN